MFKTILANFHIEKIFWILKRRAAFIIASALVLGTVAGFYAVQTSSAVYLAQITFYVYTNPDYITDATVNLSSSEVNQARNLIASYMQIMKSRTFLEKVQEEAETEYSVNALKKMISGGAIGATAAFNVNVLCSDPVEAANIANAIGELAPAEIIRIVKSGGIEILDDAEIPTIPYEETSVIKFIIIGFGGGAVLAACWFLFRGLMDTTVRRKYEIEDLFTIPMLGDVPKAVRPNRKAKEQVILNSESPFAMKESYSNIRAKLLFTAKGEKCPVYAISSADPHEGKSLTSINLAISYAQLGKKVLLIDADMRKSHLLETLELDEDKVKDGLSQYLADLVDEPNIVEYNNIIDVIVSGAVPPNPAELLASKTWHDFLEKCKEKYDAVFIDLPPIGVVSDALTLGKDVTSFVLITREGVTKFDRLEMVVRQLESVDADICGFVFNGISLKSKDYSYHKYGKDYKY